MMRNVRLQELLVGVEGLALLRNLHNGTDEEAEHRLAEVQRLLDDDRMGEGEVVTESEVEAGYTTWSDRYDEPGNPLIAVEEPVVWDLIASQPPGRALDAACGTGRHTRRLVELGHDVVGIDLSPGMLERARTQTPEATFHQSDLEHIPAEENEFGLIVCGLAIGHVEDLGPSVTEMARVLAPGGCAVISVLHPFQILLGWYARFKDSSGRRHFVREHPHTHSDYLAAFRDAGLQVRQCVEPPMTDKEVGSMERVTRHVPEAALAAYVGLPAALIWDLQKP